MPATRLSKLLLAVLFLLISFQGIAQATDQEKHDALSAVINSKNFRFVPVSATDTKGNTMQVDPGYMLKIINDSLSIDLPFFGSGYTDNFGAGNENIKFNSRAVNYTSEPTKKGGWNITILPKDKSRIMRIYLNILPTGICNMRLTATNQQLLSYYGSINDNLSN